jgi:hypothetical protein
MHLGLAPFFFRPFNFVYRVVNATPSIGKLAKVRISYCQILQVLGQLTEVRRSPTSPA